MISLVTTAPEPWNRGYIKNRAVYAMIAKGGLDICTASQHLPWRLREKRQRMLKFNRTLVAARHHSSSFIQGRERFCRRSISRTAAADESVNYDHADSGQVT